MIATAPPASTAWQFSATGAVVAPPVTANGLTIVGDTEGGLYALDAATGALRWRVKLGNAMFGTPAIAGSSVIVPQGDRRYLAFQPPEYTVAGTGPGSLGAYDLATGSPLWQYSLAGSAAGTPLLSGTSIVEHDGTGEAVALDTSGTYLWRTFVESVPTWTAVVALANGNIATSGGYPNRVTILSARTGAVVRAIDLPAAAIGCADARLATDGRSIVGSYLLQGTTVSQHIYRADPGAGRILWDAVIATASRASIDHLPIVSLDAGSAFVSSAFDARLVALNVNTGAPRWKAALSGLNFGGFVANGGTLYGATTAKRVDAIDERSGRPLGAAALEADAAGSIPAIAGNAFVIGSATGTVFSVPLDSLRSVTLPR